MRKEQEIFDDLARLCTSPGYIHAIAHLCFLNNHIGYEKELTAENMQHLFSRDRLIRTEMSTLIGLLIKTEVDFALPPPSALQDYLHKTEALLEELQSSMSAPMFASLVSGKAIEEGSDPLISGKEWREPIFYGGESAYSFQYRDLAPIKYANDDAWLLANKGFSTQTAREVVSAIEMTQNENVSAALKALRKVPPEEWTLLPGFKFTSQEIAERSGIDKSLVENVLAAFAVPIGEKNRQFGALNDFNITNALPLLRHADGSFILFHIYSLVEALYESPFYWMGDDKRYRSTAMKHRGRFTEEFSCERLELVFGKENVYSNVHILKSEKTTLGEIDVLVLFGNRAIVLQAKSKRLTLEAKKGNDGQIREDFKKSIQDAYDQGYSCAKLLTEGNYTLRSAGEKEVTTPHKLKEVYIFCVVSDHYPALSFQATQFLKFEKTETIRSPFVMDVFALDAMTEMLQSPLRFISYVNQRTNYADKLHASHELTILAYHLKQNLWLDDQHDMVQLDDSISGDLDVAMTVRRNGIPGKRTPDGILTRFENTAAGRLIEAIEERPDPKTIDLGFMLLTLSEAAVLRVSEGIDMIVKLARGDAKNHDFTIDVGGADTGLTIHCNEDPVFVASSRLQDHCKKRKYTSKANSWFGVCIDPKTALPRFGVNLHSKWEQNMAMDSITQNLRRTPNFNYFEASGTGKKIGRNEPCPCGSGIKHKKCCLNQ